MQSKKGHQIFGMAQSQLGKCEQHVMLAARTCYILLSSGPFSLSVYICFCFFLRYFHYGIQTVKIQKTPPFSIQEIFLPLPKSCHNSILNASILKNQVSFVNYIKFPIDCHQAHPSSLNRLEMPRENIHVIFFEFLEQRA